MLKRILAVAGLIVVSGCSAAEPTTTAASVSTPPAASSASSPPAPSAAPGASTNGALCGAYCGDLLTAHKAVQTCTSVPQDCTKDLNAAAGVVKQINQSLSSSSDPKAIFASAGADLFVQEVALYASSGCGTPTPKPECSSVMMNASQGLDLFVTMM